MTTPTTTLLDYVKARREIRERVTAGEWIDDYGLVIIRNDAQAEDDHIGYINICGSGELTSEENDSNAAHIADAHNHQARLESIIEVLVGALEQVESSLQCEHADYAYRTNYQYISDALTRAAGLARGDEK